MYNFYYPQTSFFFSNIYLKLEFFRYTVTEI